MNLRKIAITAAGALSGDRKGRLDLSKEKLYNMKIPSRDLKQHLPMELDH